MTPSPKKHGPLFSAAGMIGTSAMQLQDPAMPAHIRRQAATVERWVNDAIGTITPDFTPKTVDKMKKHGARFAELCVKAGLVRPGGNEQSTAVAARLMSGHYVVNHDVHRLKLKGPWKHLERTASTLLAKVVKDLPQYEADMFKVAEEMEMEVRG